MVPEAAAVLAICGPNGTKFSCEFMNMLGDCSCRLLMETVVRWLICRRGSERGPGFEL